MRLSCNFVNVYTIVYHAQYTYTCTCTHPQRISSRGKARVSDKSPPTSRSCVSGSWRARGSRPVVRAAADPLPRSAPRQAAPTSACSGHADFRARILARKSARKSVSVSVSVSVPWNLRFNGVPCRNFSKSTVAHEKWVTWAQPHSIGGDLSSLWQDLMNSLCAKFDSSSLSHSRDMDGACQI